MDQTGIVGWSMMNVVGLDLQSKFWINGLNYIVKGEKMAEKMTNKKFANEDKVFKDACEKAGVEPTTRQASKFLNKKGLAYKTSKKIK